MPYAHGYNALAICDRCGLQFRRHELLLEAQTRMRICEACIDQPWPIHADARKAAGVREALRWSRPDRPLPGPEDMPVYTPPYDPSILNE